MNTDYIVDLQVIASSGSISKAARKLNTSPQRLSSMLMSVEAEFGAKFFERSHQGLTLTPEGTLFFDEINELNNSLEMLKKTFRDNADRRDIQTLEGILTICNNISIRDNFVLKNIHTFGDVHPKLSVNYFELDTPDIMKQVTLDADSLGILNLAEQEVETFKEDFPQLNFHPLVRILPVVAIAKDSKLINASVDKIALSSIAKLPAVVLSVEQSDFKDSSVVLTLEKMGYTPTVKYATNRLQVFYDLLSHGKCYSIVYVSSLEYGKDREDYPNFRLIPIRDPIYFTLYVVYNKETSQTNIIETFLDFLFDNRYADWALSENLDYARLEKPAFPKK